MNLTEERKRKLIKVSGTIQIRRSTDEVFDFFANPSNDPLWRAEINQSLLDGPLQSGAIISEYSNLSKKAPNNLLQLKCVRFEKNTLAVFETYETGSVYLRSQRLVSAVSDTTTAVTYKLDFDPAIVKIALGFSLPRFIVSMKANKDMKKYLRQLKRRLEG